MNNPLSKGPDFSNISDEALLLDEKECWVEHASYTDGPGRMGVISWAWRVQECDKRGLTLLECDPSRSWLDWALSYRKGEG